MLGRGVFPRLRLEYGEAGGELGRAGIVTSAAIAVDLVGGLGAAYAVRPPTVHLHGVVQGPLVIRHAQTLVGGVVRGGILIRADHVTLRNVTVVGGENGIDIEHADHVMLDHVRVLRSTLNGIRALDSGVMIDDCSISSPAGPLVSGILISYSMGRSMSMVDALHDLRDARGDRDALVDGRRDAQPRDRDDRARRSCSARCRWTRRVTTTSTCANGIGIICMDHSMCEIEHNTVAGAKVDGNQNPTRAGVAIEAFFYAEAKVHHNTVVASPGGVQAFDNSTIKRHS